MNDLFFIAYDAKRMYLDTSDMTGAGERAHRRLCDRIWFGDGPPVNDNELLRQITLIRETDWGKVKQELKAKGWVETQTFFLHRGAITSLNESKEKYVENFNRTAKALKRLPLKLSAPDTETGCVSILNHDGAVYRVTRNVTRYVTPDVTPPSQSHSNRNSSQPPDPSSIKSNGASRSGQTGIPAVGDLEEDGTPLLNALALDRVAGEIMANRWGWHYDNCKVKLEYFERKGLVTVLRPYAGQASEGFVRRCWCEAVRRTHGAFTDKQNTGNPVITPGGYVIKCFRELMCGVARGGEQAMMGAETEMNCQRPSSLASSNCYDSTRTRRNR